MSLALTILGCGSSGGVPRVGQGWGACDPAEPRNRRRRCSILVTRMSTRGESTNVLIDMSPDLREQLLDADVRHLDGILMTHAHADHTHGIDDVRSLVIAAKRRIAVHMDAATAANVTDKFDYVFVTPPGSLYPPLLDAACLLPGTPCTIDGGGGAIEAIPFRLNHGEVDALGFRIGAAAYTPDVKAIPPESIDHLADLDLWIIDALRYTDHPSHFSFSDAMAWIERMRPRRAVLTNLHTDMDYGALRARLPAHVDVAYDGMQLTL